MMHTVTRKDDAQRILTAGADTLGFQKVYQSIQRAQTHSIEQDKRTDNKGHHCSFQRYDSLFFFPFKDYNTASGLQQNP